MNYEEEYQKLKASYDALKLMVDAQANAIKMYEHTLETIKVNTSRFEKTETYETTCSSDKVMLNEAMPDPVIQNEASHNLPDTHPDLANRYSGIKPVPQPTPSTGFGNPFAGTSWGS
jgi:hypothetical protein